jgi:hypothetical protein
VANINLQTKMSIDVSIETCNFLVNSADCRTRKIHYITLLRTHFLFNLEPFQVHVFHISQCLSGINLIGQDCYSLFSKEYLIKQHI